MFKTIGRIIARIFKRTGPRPYKPSSYIPTGGRQASQTSREDQLKMIRRADPESFVSPEERKAISERILGGRIPSRGVNMQIKQRIKAAGNRKRRRLPGIYEGRELMTAGFRKGRI